MKLLLPFTGPKPNSPSPNTLRLCIGKTITLYMVGGIGLGIRVALLLFALLNVTRPAHRSQLIVGPSFSDETTT